MDKEQISQKELQQQQSWHMVGDHFTSPDVTQQAAAGVTAAGMAFSSQLYGIVGDGYSGTSASQSVSGLATTSAGYGGNMYTDQVSGYLPVGSSGYGLEEYRTLQQRTEVEPHAQRKRKSKDVPDQPGTSTDGSRHAQSTKRKKGSGEISRKDTPFTNIGSFLSSVGVKDEKDLQLLVEAAMKNQPETFKKVRVEDTSQSKRDIVTVQSSEEQLTAAAAHLASTPASYMSMDVPTALASTDTSQQFQGQALTGTTMVEDDQSSQILVLQQQRALLQQQAAALEQQERALMMQDPQTQAMILQQQQTQAVAQEAALWQQQQLLSQQQPMTTMQQQYADFAYYLGSSYAGQTQTCPETEDYTALTPDDLDIARSMASSQGMDLSMTIQALKLVKHLGPSGFDDILVFGDLLTRVGRGELDMADVAAVLPSGIKELIMTGKLKPDFIDMLMKAFKQGEEEPYVSGRAGLPIVNQVESCEVFVYGIPNTAEEAELRERFPRAGKIDIPFNAQTNRNRGYAHLTFDTVADAKLAVKNMNGAVMGSNILQVRFHDNPSKDKQPKKSVEKSTEEKKPMEPSDKTNKNEKQSKDVKLYVSGIPSSWDKNHLRDHFSATNYKKLQLLKQKSRCKAAFVFYKNEADAKEALEMMDGAEVDNYCTLSVQFALTSESKQDEEKKQDSKSPEEPSKHSKNTEEPSKTTKLFVKDIPCSWNENHLSYHFSKTKYTKIKLLHTEAGQPKKAFVFYKNEADGKEAIEMMDGIEVDGFKLTVEFSIKKNAEKKREPEQVWKLYIGGIPSGSDIKDLEDMFPTATRVDIPPSTKTKPAGEKWYGFAIYNKMEEAERIRKTMNGARMGGNKLVVYYAKSSRQPDDFEAELVKESPGSSKNVHLRKLYMSNIPLEVESKDIYSTFPGVIKVDFPNYQPNERVGHKYAFVTFRDKGSAERVLKRKFTLKGNTLKIRQPVSNKNEVGYQLCMIHVKKIPLKVKKEDVLNAFEGAIKVEFHSSKKGILTQHADVTFGKEEFARQALDASVRLLEAEVEISPAEVPYSRNCGVGEQGDATRCILEPPDQDMKTEPQANQGKTNSTQEKEGYVEDPCSLYIPLDEIDLRNLNNRTITEDVKKIFPDAKLVSTTRRSAIVKYDSAEQAKASIQRNKWAMLYGVPLTIEYKKTPIRSPQQKQLGTGNQGSVPQRMPSTAPETEMRATNSSDMEVPNPFRLFISFSEMDLSCISRKQIMEEVTKLFPTSSYITASKSCARLTFDEAEQAKIAMDTMQGVFFHGAPLHISYAITTRENLQKLHGRMFQEGSSERSGIQQHDHKSRYFNAENLDTQPNYGTHVYTVGEDRRVSEEYQQQVVYPGQSASHVQGDAYVGHLPYSMHQQDAGYDDQAQTEEGYYDDTSYVHWDASHQMESHKGFADQEIKHLNQGQMLEEEGRWEMSKSEPISNVDMDESDFHTEQHYCNQ